MKLKQLFCPDSFKGCLSSLELCQGLAETDNLRCQPLSDGGEGFLKILETHLSLEWHKTQALNLAKQMDEVSWASQRKTAFVELAKIIGHRQKPPGPLMNLSSQGIGQVIKDILDKGFEKIVIACGGTATHDGGVGMIEALGGRFLDEQGESLTWNQMDRAHSLNAPQEIKAEIICLCDVTTTFLDSIDLYAPQKGATPTNLVKLKSFFTKLTKIYGNKNLAHGGVAGGLGLALAQNFGAHLVSGFEYLMGLCRLESQIKNADLILTGEGRLDASTLQGKVVAQVASLATKYEKPCHVICGTWDGETLPEGVIKVRELAAPQDDIPLSPQETLERVRDIILGNCHSERSEESSRAGG